MTVNEANITKWNEWQIYATDKAINNNIKRIRRVTGHSTDCSNVSPHKGTQTPWHRKITHNKFVSNEATEPNVEDAEYDKQEGNNCSKENDQEKDKHEHS